jgi:cytoskeletal protein CcmA (bactofilin family)
VSDVDENNQKHVDEITLMLYVERQLEREAAHEVSLHTQTCERCLTLLRALDRESRLLTRSMLEEDEPLPARLAEFQNKVRRSMQWIWGVVFGMAVLGVYALYTDYIEAWYQQIDQAGFGSSNLVSLLVFQGAFWKGWESMMTLVEFVALACAAGFGLFALRRYLRRGTTLAVMFATLGLIASVAPAASAMEFRQAESVRVEKDQTVKGDLYVTSQTVHMQGTVDGDLYAAAKDVDISGHVTGDVLCACQSLRISGQVDGNIRGFSNNLTITGTVARSISSFSETFNLDHGGKIGGSLTSFAQSLTVDGAVGRDLLAFFRDGNISGAIGGDVRARGGSLNIAESASIEGRTNFTGDNAPEVASGAKLGSQIEFRKWEHRSHMERSGGYYVWKVIWAAAWILFGLILLSIMPVFSAETVRFAENYGASFGLGVLVFFGVFIAACLACITIVGLLAGISTLFLWLVTLFASYVVVGAVIGRWFLGRTDDVWPLVGRMALGVVVIKILAAIPHLGFWVTLAVWIWGMGAVSLALYRRLQPVLAPNVPPPPFVAPASASLPPNTTVGGI